MESLNYKGSRIAIIKLFTLNGRIKQGSRDGVIGAGSAHFHVTAQANNSDRVELGDIRLRVICCTVLNCIV